MSNIKAQYAALQALLGNLSNQGGCKPVSTVDPFTLDQADKVWFIIKGQVEIVYKGDLSLTQNQACERSLCTLTTGQIILNLHPCKNAAQFIAKPSTDAQLVACHLPQMLALTQQDTAHQVIIRQLLEQWVNTLSRWSVQTKKPAIAAPIIPQPNIPVDIPAQTEITTQTALLWCPIQSDDLLYNGVKPVLALGYDGFFPLIPMNNLKVTQACKITVISTQDWLEQPTRLKDLLRFHAVITSMFSWIEQSTAANQQHLFQQRQIFMENRYVSALDELAGVLEQGRSAPKLVLNHPLVAAFQVVLKHIGIEYNDEQFARMRANQVNLHFLTRQVECFQRKVVLESNWWQQDHGPLLGYYQQKKRPCALIPIKRGGYLLIDPINKTQQRINSEIATQIQPAAWMFYQSLPRHPLRLRDLFSTAKKGTRRDFIYFVVTLIFPAFLSLLTPIIIGWIFSPIIQDALTHQLKVAVIAMTLTAIAMGGSTFIQSIALLRLQGHMGLVAQAGVWDRILKLPVNFFRRFHVGDFVYRAQGVDRIASMLSSSIPQLLLGSLTGILTFCLMLYYSWLLACVALGLIIVYLALSYLSSKIILKRLGSVQEEQGKLVSLIFQLLSVITKIKTTGSERAAFSQWAKRYSTLTRVTYNVNRMVNLTTIVKALFNQAGLMIIFVVIGLQAHVLFAFFHQPRDLSMVSQQTLQAVIPANHFIAFNIAFGMFMGAFFGFVNVAIQMLAVKPASRRLKPILEALPEKTQGVIIPEKIVGQMSIQRVSFRYAPTAPLVLQNINMEIQAGQFIAIVGPSGSGKSTLMRLLLSFEQPTIGSIYFDQQDINNLNMVETRRWIGAIMQNSQLIAGSIFENIATEATTSEEDVWRALKLAQLSQEVAEMPMQLETMVSEGATTLSVGQKQRLLIARAVARQPKILIFDEATSALDNATQAQISRSLESLKCTRIVIAHRHSTIIHADTIYVMAQGQLIEQGNYQALMAKRALFYKLVAQQMI